MTTTDIRDHAHAFLKSHPIASLATINPDGTPAAASVFFAVNDDLHLFFATRQHSRKYHNLEINTHVAATITDLEQFTTIQLMGTATEINNPLTIAWMIEQLAITTHRAAQRWLPPIKALRDGTLVVMEITPTWMRLGDFRDPHEDVTAYYTTIIEADQQ